MITPGRTLGYIALTAISLTLHNHFGLRDTDAEAEITFLPTEHGGRDSSVRSDYRGQFYYDGHDWDAIQSYPEVDEVRPGETARAYLTFISPDQHAGRLQPGKMFLVREGNRVVAYGQITRLLGLDSSAARVRGQRAAD
jgi:translation elongation factor EF-Tu-like GTPase